MSKYDGPITKRDVETDDYTGQQILALLDERDALKAENDAWRKTTGRDDPEALDFELGRAGIDTHLQVLTELRDKAQAEAATLREQLAAARAERDKAVERYEGFRDGYTNEREEIANAERDEARADAERLAGALRTMVDDLECSQPLVKHALHVGNAALGRSAHQSGEALAERDAEVYGKAYAESREMFEKCLAAGDYVAHDTHVREEGRRAGLEAAAAWFEDGSHSVPTSPNGVARVLRDLATTPAPAAATLRVVYCKGCNNACESLGFGGLCTLCREHVQRGGGRP